MLPSAWTFASTAAGAAPTPAELPPLDWRPAQVPGTVATNLGGGLDHPGIDSLDWWFRTTLTAPPGPTRLTFEGLATIAEVWLDGVSILRSRNMFRPAAVDVELTGANELVIVLRSVERELSGRRPRPRWRTALVDNQNLRWLRTSLMGRIPSWTPAAPCIGPWREVRVEPIPLVEAIDLRADLIDGDGVVRLRAHHRGVTEARLEIGADTFPVHIDGDSLTAEVVIPDPPRWWPHTHGTPRLLDARLWTPNATVDLGRIGFRTVEVAQDDDRVELRVNGRAVFCRGACWMPDPLRLDGPPGRAEATVRRAVEAGANMLRVGGTTTWAEDELLRACDALGVLVWQDLPFANMDPPWADEGFRADVLAEVDAQVARLRPHPSVAVYCGGSEVHQQAAMMGLPEADRALPMLETDLPARIAALHPGVPWFASTPIGGALPFHTARGLTHYYGVGAYRRPLTDVRRARVRFTPECLGFSNVPAHTTHVPHHPEWKRGVPRDNGAGWDFEDIRDHYLRELYQVDPVALRSVDPERYLALSRVVPGELMLRTFAEWRRPGSGCGGALVWFLRDLRPGAGWGVIDSDGAPKATLRYLARAWARRAVLLTDEGLDGVDLHVHNEADTPLEGVVELELWSGRIRTGAGRSAVSVAPYAACTLQGDTILGTFHDLAHAYRFGPPKHEAVVARLVVEGVVIHEDVLFPGSHQLRSHASDVLTATAARADDGVTLTLQTIALLQAVTIDSDGWDAEDDSFPLVPGAPRVLRLRPRREGAAFKAYIGALNLDGTLTVRA